MTTKKKTGLGRGLNTLIPSAPVKETETEKILKKDEQIKSEVMVPILKVEPNPDQPRRQFDEGVTYLQLMNRNVENLRIGLE